jgi:hypothetical protein
LAGKDVKVTAHFTGAPQLPLPFSISQNLMKDQALSALPHVVTLQYTQSPIIRNGHTRLDAEFWGKFKKQELGRSNLRNASKIAQYSDLQS